jgi:hypothetical protein
MDEIIKLLSAHRQVENCLLLLKGNEFEQHMCGKLYSVKYELERQISNHSNCNADNQPPIAENKNAEKSHLS